MSIDSGILRMAMALLLSAPLPSGAWAATFQSALLAKLGKAIGYTPTDTLAAGTYEAGTAMGKRVVATYDDRHTVTLLGLNLFPEELKRSYNSHIYDFLERYFLELHCWTDKATLAQKLRDDKVMFTHGSLSDIAKISPATPFTVNRTGDKYYEVAWANDGATVLAVAFPIQGELLLGMPLPELEATLYDRIVAAAPFEEAPAERQYAQEQGNIYYPLPSQKYELESVTNRSYFYKQPGGKYALVQDTIQKAYSAINLFHHLTKADNPMRVTQRLYGFKSSEFTVTLRQWLNYCHQEGLEVYTGVEEEYADGLKLLVVAHDKDLGYNHLLSATIPYAALTKPKAELQVVANAFIPSHNVKTLYDTYKPKSKKKTY